MYGTFAIGTVAALTMSTAALAANAPTVKSIEVEVELSEGFSEAMNLSETRLVGDVAMVQDSDNSRLEAYTLTADINAAKPLMPADIGLVRLPADTRVYYDAMIQTFAQSVVDRLK